MNGVIRFIRDITLFLTTLSILIILQLLAPYSTALITLIPEQLKLVLYLVFLINLEIPPLLIS